MDEFSKNIIQEQLTYPENVAANEFNEAAAEYAVYDEFKTYEEAKDTEGVSVNEGINVAKKNRALASMSAGVVSAIAAVTVGITSLLNVQMNAEFNKVDYLDGQIAYEISVEDMTENETLTAYLLDENEEIVDQADLVDEDGDGIITGSFEIDGDAVNEKIKSGESEIVSYRINLNGIVGLEVERKFDSYVIEIAEMTSVFNDISGECHCGVDGCYHFTMNYTDDMGVFDNFEAYIEDSFGNKADCTFTDDLHGEQKIFVGDLKGSNAHLVVTYTAGGKPETVKIAIKM